MFTEDYVLRMISQAMAALVYISGFKKAGQYREAQQAIDQALEQLLGLRADLIKQLSDEALFTALTQQGRLDTERLGLIADFFTEEGDIFAAQNRLANSQECYSRALTYHLKVGLADEKVKPSTELTQKIEELVQKLNIQNLSEDPLWALFCYYEQAGDYANAEVFLTNLAARPDLRAETQPELIAFYERLLEKHPGELARSKMNRVQVQERLSKIREDSTLNSHPAF